VSIAKQYNCKILLDDENVKGFGGSIINGLKNLSSNYFCIFDGDNSFDPKGISLMMKEMINGYDFVFGTRYLGGAISDDDTLFSKLANYVISKIVKILFRINTTDVLFFYVLGKKENIAKLDLKQQDMRICTEFLVKSYKNFKCKEVLSKERKRFTGVSKVNKVFEGLKILGNILKLYFN
jgi:glycosyltransferase involved in cell wall biosynthesis